MGILTHLEPSRVFYYFEELSKIPHGSFNTKQISDYCVNFAKENNLKYIQDENNNVIIFKDASAGYENSDPVIIQGHLDMVCCKSDECTKDMEKEGLDLEIDGDYIKAKGTTLGGDDGIAVAYALAILEDNKLEHPPLEVIFTVDEEVGMLGATSIDLSMIKGNKLLNIDSEVEGVMTVSCAGGASVECEIPVACSIVSGTVYEVKLSKLSGGHSGVEIHKGRANAIKELGGMLGAVCEKININIVSSFGGAKDNAIADSSVLRVVVNEKDEQAFVDTVNEWFGKIKTKYLSTDPDMSLAIDVLDKNTTANVWDTDSTASFVKMLCDIPFGVVKMSEDIDNLVQTSLNHGILKADSEGINFVVSVRSSISEEKKELVEKIEETVISLGGKCSVSGDYPAWEYRKDSPLRNLIEEVYIEQYGKKPVIEAIHAGLECGVLAQKIKDLDAVSMGPDLLDIHTAEERMSISSVKRVWEFILEILKRSK